MLVMCKKSREIIDGLDEFAHSRNAQRLTTPGQVYMCDYLVLTFMYAPAILTFIKSDIKKSPNPKKFDITYWKPERIHLQRSDRDMSDTGVNNLDGFKQIVMNYLLVDYSINDALAINRLCERNTASEIETAVGIAKRANVYSIPYLTAILDRMFIERMTKDAQTAEINKRVAENDIKLTKERIVKHTPLELAQMQYEWEEKEENARLEKLFKEKFGL